MKKFYKSLATQQRVNIRAELLLRDEEWCLCRLVCVTAQSENDEMINHRYGNRLFLRFTMSGKDALGIFIDIKKEQDRYVTSKFPFVGKTYISDYNENRLYHQKLSSGNSYGFLSSEYPADFFEMNIGEIKMNSNSDPLVAKSLPYFPTIMKAECYYLYGTVPQQYQSLPSSQLQFLLDDRRSRFVRAQVREMSLTIYYSVESEDTTGTELKVYSENPLVVDSFPLNAVGSQTITFDEIPSEVHFALTNNEQVLDNWVVEKKRIRSPWSTVNRDITIEVDKKSEIEELIQNSGESNTVEFKLHLPEKIDGLLKTIVAFSNTVGGYILLGVDDQGKIEGIDPKGLMEKVANALDDRASGVIQPTFEQYEIDGKTIVVINVEEGHVKPYALRKTKDKSDTLTYYVRRFGSTRQAQPEDIRRWLGIHIEENPFI